MKVGTLLRLDDGSGYAKYVGPAKDFEGAIRIRYPSGAKRIVHKRDVGPKQSATPAERDLMASLLDAPIRNVTPPYREALGSLMRADYVREVDGMHVLTETGERAAEKLS